MNHSSSHEHLTPIKSSYVMATEKKRDYKLEKAIDNAYYRKDDGEKTFCQRCNCEIEVCEILCSSCDEAIDLEKEVMLCQ